MCWREQAVPWITTRLALHALTAKMCGKGVAGGGAGGGGASTRSHTVRVFRRGCARPCIVGGQENWPRSTRTPSPPVEVAGIGEPYARVTRTVPAGRRRLPR